MAFRPLISPPNWRALVIAGLCFAVSYPIAAWVLPGVPPVLALLLFVALLVGCGAVVGYIANRSPLMHGVLLGAFLGLIGIVVLGAIGGLGVGDIAGILKSGLPALVSMAIPGITLCALGAVLGDHLRERRRVA
jgi:hypothetical protein